MSDIPGRGNSMCETRGKRHERVLCVRGAHVAGWEQEGPEVGRAHTWIGMLLDAFGSALGETWTFMEHTVQDGTLVGGFRCPCN